MKDKIKYMKGQILKSSARSKECPLIVMVCENGCHKLDQTESQFNAIVLLDRGSDCLKPGFQSNTWSKGFWSCSSFEEINEIMNS
jgi:hypothetical protein